MPAVVCAGEATVGGVRSVVEPSCSCACGRGLSTTRSWTTAPPVRAAVDATTASPSGRSLHPRAAGPCPSLRLGPRPRTPASHKYASWPPLEHGQSVAGGPARRRERGSCGSRAARRGSRHTRGGASSAGALRRGRPRHRWQRTGGTGTDRSAARTRAARTARRTACALRSGTGSPSSS